jgi:hypothetical protein
MLNKSLQIYVGTHHYVCIYVCMYVSQILTRRTAYEDGEAFEVHNFKSLTDAVKEQSAVEGQILLCNTTYIHTYIHTYTVCIVPVCIVCMYCIVCVCYIFVCIIFVCIMLKLREITTTHTYIHTHIHTYIHKLYGNESIYFSRQRAHDSFEGHDKISTR